LKAKFNTVEHLATSSGAGSSFNPRTGSSATTTSEQSVIDNFAASNLVVIGTSVFNSYLMDKQNFQHGGFQFYNVMAFVIPSTVQGHSSFHGTRSYDANPAGALDDNKDMPGMFSLSWQYP
jgi:hypothetical protein